MGVSGQQYPTIRRRLFRRRMPALWKPTSPPPPASSSNPIKPGAPAPPQYKLEVLVALESSALSAPVSAGQCGVKYSTLAAWIGAQKSGEQNASRENTPAFLFAEVASSTNGPALEVQLPCGAVVRASDAEQIRLLAALLPYPHHSQIQGSPRIYY